MFNSLLQNSPEILTALGVSPESITAEINKQQAVEKLKVNLVQYVINNLVNVYC